MMTFAIVAALLVTGVLLVLVPPLAVARPARGTARDTAVTAVYRDQLGELERDVAAGVLARVRYDEARADIERRLLAEVANGAECANRVPAGRRACWAVALALPVAAAAVYWLTGTPQALAPRGSAGVEAPHALEPSQVQAMVARLAQRLEREPGDAEGWAMLARSYSAMRRYADAAQAYSQAAARGTPDAQLLVDYADALGMAQGRRLAGAPEVLVARALSLDPNHVKALSLAASAAFEQRHYEAAIGHWERVLTRIPADSEMARSTRSSIAQARARLDAPAR